MKEKFSKLEKVMRKSFDVYNTPKKKTENFLISFIIFYNND